MTRITITLETKLNHDLSNIGVVNDEINAVKAAFDDRFKLVPGINDDGFPVFTGQVPGTKAPAPEGEPITRVVEVNGRYVYLLYVDDVGDVRVGGRVDVESRNGGHWAGKVTKVYGSVDYYIAMTEEEPPTLMVQEVIDAGPA